MYHIILKQRLATYKKFSLKLMELQTFKKKKLNSNFHENVSKVNPKTHSEKLFGLIAARLYC